MVMKIRIAALALAVLALGGGIFLLVTGKQESQSTEWEIVRVEGVSAVRAEYRDDGVKKERWIKHFDAGAHYEYDGKEYPVKGFAERLVYNGAEDNESEYLGVIAIDPKNPSRVNASGDKILFGFGLTIFGGLAALVIGARIIRLAALLKMSK